MRARFACLCAMLITAAGVWAAGGQALPALNDVLARVGDYASRYERDLSGIVAEEHYIQKADPPVRPAATLMTELIVESAGVRSTTHVSYQSEPLVGFLVPVEMREDYVLLSRGTPYQIEGTATYSNFRQFTVKTNEQIGPIKRTP